MITKFDKKNLTTLRPELEKRLKAIEAELGITFKLGSCKFNDISATFALECLAMTETGETVDKRAEDFKRLAVMYGLEPSDLGKTITLTTRKGTEVFTIVGLESRPRVSKPVVIQKAGSDETYRIDVETALRKLGRS